MTYTKPEVVAVGRAAEAIQTSQLKEQHNTPDQSQELATSSAYEADE